MDLLGFFGSHSDGLGVREERKLISPACQEAVGLSGDDDAPNHHWHHLEALPEHPQVTKDEQGLGIRVKKHGFVAPEPRSPEP